MPRLSFLLAFTLLLSSCSLAFRREWKSALKAAPQSGAQGAWEGTWHSEPSGHHGRLRCVVGPAKDDKGTHAFHYHATWAGILSGSYQTDHQVTPTREALKFKGQHKMPDWAGGLYTYEGKVVGDDFEATYECKLDHGSYRMKRVQKRE